jgi:serine beta-lactamase-like protein LACTB
MKKSLCFIFLSILIFSGSVWAQTITSEQQVKIDGLVAEFMRNSKVPGLALSIAVKGEIAYSKGYGFADVEQQVAVDPSKTKFRIASISKTVTADALMQLVEAKKLDLDAPIQKYVPSFPEKRWPLTTRIVGGHLGGIRHYRGNEMMSAKFYPNVAQGLEIFKDDSLLFEPVTKYSYSSYGYNLISAVIEGVAGMDFLTYMQLNVFDKLNMNNTEPEFMNNIITNRGRYYERKGDGVANSPYVDNSYKWAGGGFLSTSEDLIKFAKAHTNSDYLSKASLKTLTTSQKTSDGKDTKYGIGWRTDTDKEGHHWIGHTGGAVGGSSKFMIYPDEKIIIVVLTNLSSAGLRSLPDQISWVLMK